LSSNLQFSCDGMILGSLLPLGRYQNFESFVFIFSWQHFNIETIRYVNRFLGVPFFIDFNSNDFVIFDVSMRKFLGKLFEHTWITGQPLPLVLDLPARLQQFFMLGHEAGI
jgi:hypothetical protein